MDSILRQTISLDWITLIIIGSLAMLAIAKYFYSNRFEDLIVLLGSEKFLATRSKENVLWHPFNVLLLIVQLVSVSLFLFLGYCILQEKNPAIEFKTFIIILLGYISFETVKSTVERLIGYLLNFQGSMQAYLYRKLSFRNFLSLLIIVFCCFIVYSNQPPKLFFYTTLGISILLYGISLATTLRKFQDQILYHPSYFILYFCTLEIAPYYILYKTLI